MHSHELALNLCWVLIPFIFSLYFFVFLKKERIGLLLLLATGFILRLILINADPYLQDWDERFHALVAKNMIDYPFKPMLRMDPIAPYDLTSWCCNHIWVHKQPVFLWQMALSMKLFGVNEIALRLPSAILGTLNIYFVYAISQQWFKKGLISFFAAIFATFSFFQLELMTGRFSVDHNDVAFSFYVTASIWAFMRYLSSDKLITWAILVGIFSGLAVLNKWLPGLIIYFGWFSYLLYNRQFFSGEKNYRHLVLSVLVAFVVFIPWQLYILHSFPAEAAASYAHNRMHITEVLGGHAGNISYHIDILGHIYNWILIPFLVLGLAHVLFRQEFNKGLSIALLSMVVVIFAFFSLIVATKMPAFTYPVSSLLFGLMGLGFMKSVLWISEGSDGDLRRSIYFMSLISAMFLAAYLSLKPGDIAKFRSQSNMLREAKMHNTSIYKNFPVNEYNRTVVLNAKSFEDVELMFYKDINVFHWWFEENVLDSLQSLGYRFAAFPNHNDQHLPAYIGKDTSIHILTDKLH